MPRKSSLSPVAEPVAELTEEMVENETPFDQFVESQRKAIVEASKAFSALVPDGVREHGQNAVREMFEGYRTLFNSTVDDLIKRLEGVRLEEKVDKPAAEEIAKN